MTKFVENMADLTHYNVEMRKSFFDKAFFLDKMEADVFVDYGCADGSFMNFLHTIFPEKIYIGYDISESEIELARQKYPQFKFFSDWQKLMFELSNHRGTIALIANSILHEIYSYGTEPEIAEFWRRTEAFDYLIIRDMSVSGSSSRPSDLISVAKVIQKFGPIHLKQFQEQWGSIYENWSMIHFLLKYRYVENWDRELKENYLPINFETLLSTIPNRFEPIFIEHFTLPFIRATIQKDFGIDLQDRTHVKGIWKNGTSALHR